MRIGLGQFRLDGHGEPWYGPFGVVCSDIDVQFKEVELRAFIMTLELMVGPAVIHR